LFVKWNWVWRGSWRYYTSYDNGEWRRHATPIYKADAERQEGGGGVGPRASLDRRSVTTHHDDIIDIDDSSDGDNTLLLTY